MFQSHIHEVQRATSQPMNLICQYTGTALASFGLAFYLSWKLALIIIAGIPIVIILLPIFSARVQPIYTPTLQSLVKQKNLHLVLLILLRQSTSNKGEESEAWKYTKKIHEAAEFYYMQTFWNGLQQGVVRLFTLSIFVQGFWFGTVLLDKGQISRSNILITF